MSVPSASSPVEPALASFADWLAENGVAHWARWLDEIRTQAEPISQDRILVVRMGSKLVPAGMMSLLCGSVDLVDCDPQISMPVRFRRFEEGRVVSDIAKEEGFGKAEVGAAMVATYISEGDERHGEVDVTLMFGGEESPELEDAFRSYVSSPYLVVSHDAGYSYARLAALIGARSVHVDDEGLLAEWNRAQLIPATALDLSPVELVTAARDAVPTTVADELSQPNRMGTHRVLLVSYYAPPATPVSVQRLDYWHRVLPDIAASRGQEMEVDWLTATAGARGEPGMIVVQDQGPWKIGERWFDVYRESKDMRLDPLGISWSHFIEAEFIPATRYDTVILSGNPFHYFGLAESFKRAWGARVILDFRDPFAYNPRFNYSVEQRAHAMELEAGWVRSADAVVSVNQECLDTISPRIDIPRYTVANGYDESLVDSIDAVDNDERTSCIAYSGTVFAALPLDHVLDALPAERFRLHHFGRDYSATKRAADHPAARAHGLVTYRELIANLKSCVAGIVMTTGESSTQTTKLFDYLACDLEVIIVTNGRPKTGNLHHVTKGLKGVHWVRNQPADLRRFFDSYEPMRVERPERLKFSRRHQTERLYDVITGTRGA